MIELIALFPFALIQMIPPGDGAREFSPLSALGRGVGGEGKVIDLRESRIYTTRHTLRWAAHSREGQSSQGQNHPLSVTTHARIADTMAAKHTSLHRTRTDGASG